MQTLYSKQILVRRKPRAKTNRALPLRRRNDLPQRELNSARMLLHFLLSSLDLEPPSYFASQVAQLVKNLPATRDLDFNPWVGKIPWGRAWQPTPVFLPGESPWTEVPGRLQSIGSQRVGHD